MSFDNFHAEIQNKLFAVSKSDKNKSKRILKNVVKLFVLVFGTLSTAGSSIFFNQYDQKQHLEFPILA